MIDNRAVGKTIAALRQSRNMTQQQLAAMLNVSHQAVSKWENGAALPDVQTLMDLTRFFGITVEQLFSGEIPEDRLASKSPFEEPIRDIGNFFNNIVNGIFRPESGDDGAEEAKTQADGEALDLDRLIQMAPFMSRAAVEEMLLRHRGQLTAGDVARFAPYISRECLEALMGETEGDIDWDVLQKIAPFLKREVVDRLAKLVAEGGRAARDAVNNGDFSVENIDRAIGDVSQTIGKGVEKVVRTAAKIGGDVASGVTDAFNSFVEGARTREDRAQALRRAAIDRALQDGRWDWLANHVDEIDDEDLRREIARKAVDAGMRDWVVEHMSECADAQTVDEAIAAAEWDWLGDNICAFEPEVQRKIALAAAGAGQWRWLSDHGEQINLDDCADAIARAAYDAGERALAVSLMGRAMYREQREALADVMAEKGDFDALEEAAPHLTAEYFGRMCLAQAQKGQWAAAERFAERADCASIERMTELAIAEGNFEAIDVLNPLL